MPNIHAFIDDGRDGTPAVDRGGIRFPNWPTLLARLMGYPQGSFATDNPRVGLRGLPRGCDQYIRYCWRYKKPVLTTWVTLDELKLAIGDLDTIYEVVALGHEAYQIAMFDLAEIIGQMAYSEALKGEDDKHVPRLVFWINE